MAEDVLKGEVPGSSAGGEQPKFTAFSSGYESHVIVKFSPRGDTEIAKRWRDILITEYHAAQIINENICPAARTRFLEAEGRLFLETRRFDRLGVSGRYSMISLQAIDNEFTGLGHNWGRVMGALKAQGLVSRQDAHVAGQLLYFGQLIHNTDMHLGNLSLCIDGEMFRLLPCVPWALRHKVSARSGHSFLMPQKFLIRNSIKTTSPVYGNWHMPSGKTY